MDSRDLQWSPEQRARLAERGAAPLVVNRILLQRPLFPLNNLIRYPENSYMQRKSVANLEGYLSPFHASLAGEPMSIMLAWWFWHGWQA